MARLERHSFSLSSICINRTDLSTAVNTKFSDVEYKKGQRIDYIHCQRNIFNDKVKRRFLNWPGVYLKCKNIYFYCFVYQKN